MRIVMVTPFAGDAFGQERAVGETCRLLQNAGHSVALVYDRLTGSLPPHSAALEVKGLSMATSATIHQQALKEIENFDAQVVHLHDLFDAHLVREIAQRFPLTFTAHTVAATCPASSRQIAGAAACTQKSGWTCLRHHGEYGCLNFKNGLHRAHAVYSYLRRRNALRTYSQVVFAISPYVERVLVHDGWQREKIEVVYNAVETSGVLPLSDVPQPLIVFAARLEVLKGLETLLRALARMTDRPWTLWICGEGSQRTALEALAQTLGIADRVSFRGRTSPQQTSQILASASVVVAPNLGPEAFGLTLAEASLLGVPVIASAVPAMDETLKDKGILIAPGNAVQLQEALLNVLGDPAAAKERALRAQSSLEVLCSPRKHLDQTLAGYERALKGRPLSAFCLGGMSASALQGRG